MNSLILALYFANLTDKLSELSVLIMICCIFLIIFFGIIYTQIDENRTDDPENYKNMAIKVGKTSFIIFIISFILYVFLPNSKFIYMSIGLKTAEFSVEKLTENAEFDKVRKLINLKLDELIKDNDLKEIGEQK